MVAVWMAWAWAAWPGLEAPPQVGGGSDDLAWGRWRSWGRCRRATASHGTTPHRPTME